MATAILVQFPVSAVTRSIKERRILSSYFKESREMFPERTAAEHWETALFAASIADVLAKRSALT